MQHKTIPYFSFLLLCAVTIFIFNSGCVGDDKEVVLSEKKDAAGRLMEKVVSGYHHDEGSYRRTFRYDTLGKILEECGVINGSKAKIEYLYHGDTAYSLYYYDLGPASSYTDSIFVANKNNLIYAEHFRLDFTGKVEYELRKNYGEDSNCFETFYDTTGNTRESREISCDKALHFHQYR